jgi:hypothetical protein
VPRSGGTRVGNSADGAKQYFCTLLPATDVTIARRQRMWSKFVIDSVYYSLTPNVANAYDCLEEPNWWGASTGEDA